MGKRKRNASGNSFFLTFAIIGVILLAVGIIWFVKNMEFRKNAAEISAVIDNIETSRDSDGDLHHTVYVSYEYDGEEYSHVRISTYTSGMYVGKRIKILCDPDNPRRVDTSAGIFWGGITCMVIGAAFALVGTIPLIMYYRKQKRKVTFMQTGRRIMAVVDRIDINTSYCMNGRNPYVIYCIYTDESTGMKYRYKTGNLWTDPTEIYAPGMEIPVYINGNDYSDYVVDAETLMNDHVVDYT